MTDGERVGRQTEAREEIHFFVHDQLLGMALGNIWRRAGRVANDQFDPVPGNRIAMGFHVGLRAVQELAPDVGEGAAGLDHHPNLDGLRSRGRRCGSDQRNCDTPPPPRHVRSSFCASHQLITHASYRNALADGSHQSDVTAQTQRKTKVLHVRNG
jgi:hypothetical protein